MGSYLVTGGAGFIGSNIVRALLDRGEKVRVIDNFATGRRENIQELLGRIELLEGDIREPDACSQACRGMDVVLHQAAIPSVPRSMEEPVLTHQVNVDGTFNMLMAARDAKVKRFVYAASSSAYGETPELPKREDMPVVPISPYGAQKAIGETYCLAFYKSFGFQTVALRYFNVFGPRQDPKSQYAAVIPKFITAMLQQKQPTIFGDGKQSRDFSYIDNVVEANLLAAAAPETHGEVVNIACAEAIDLLTMVDMLNEILGTDIKPKLDPPRPGDIKHSFADISRAADLLGYKPLVSFRRGLEQTVQWYRK